MKTLILVLLIAFPMAAQEDASKWRKITRSDSFEFFYIPSKLIVVNSALRRAWIKQVPRNLYAAQIDRSNRLKEMGLQPSKYGTLAYNLVYEEVNCHNRDEREITVIDYDRFDERIFVTDLSDTKWDSPLPDSVGEIIVNVLCSSDAR
jgi:hypothetical protein